MAPDLPVHTVLTLYSMSNANINGEGGSESGFCAGRPRAAMPDPAPTLLLSQPPIDSSALTSKLLALAQLPTLQPESPPE
jgi:hypothetical protein